MTAIAISAAALARVYQHAREAFPAECCGYIRALRAPGREPDDVVPCTNAEAPAVADRGFVIDGKELFAFARSFDTDRPARIVYHSHPNGRAYFSETDRAMAMSARYPVQHLVVGVTAEAITECAQFAIVGDDVVEVARWAA